MQHLKAFITRYQHQLSIGFFLVGFIFDSIILKRIDLLVSHVLIISYLSVVLISIAMLHVHAARKLQTVWAERMASLVPFVSQFAFGGLFSGFLIFYSQSGALIASWPFLLLIVVLIGGNEFMRTYQYKLTYQALLLFFCFFSFAIYVVPIFFGRMGDPIFLISGAVALIAFVLFLSALFLLNRRRLRGSLYDIVLGAVAIYGLVTVLYFSNVLPPIPLALKDVGVYHSLLREGTTYRATTEPQAWYAPFGGTRMTVTPTASLVVFSSVFAPTRLATSIVHEWQYADPVHGWTTVSTIPFAISGGRDGGYRGYTIYGPLKDGKWRVNVKTPRGQLIGRTIFNVQVSTSVPHTVTRILE